MTVPQASQQAPQQAPQQPPPPPRVVPEPGSRLEQLCGQLEAARAAKREAEALEKSITKGIQVAALALAPAGTRAVIVAGRPGVPDWKCHWVPGGLGLDTARIREERPDILAYYAKPTAGYWKTEKAR